MTDPQFDAMKQLSPKRNTSTAGTVEELAREQLEHFSIDPESDYGETLMRTVMRMYQCQTDVNQLWELTLGSINSLDQADKIQRFNAKKFLSFQLAKILDTLQHPFRKSY